MTSEEKSAAAQRLQVSRDVLRAAVEGVSDEQWSFQPDEETWSIGQCVHHLCLTERQVLASLRQKTATEPPRTDLQAEVAGKDELIVKRVPVRRGKAPAPAESHPSSAAVVPRDVVAEFLKVREATIDFLETTPANLREYFFEHFALKQLDAYQWLLLMSAHAERHAAQIAEVKTHPDYPLLATSSGLP